MHNNKKLFEKEDQITHDKRLIENVNSILNGYKEKNKKIIAKRIMKQDFIALSPETYATEAEKLMQKQNSNCVLITEVDEILGIFTTNDLIKIKKTNL